MSTAGTGEAENIQQSKDEKREGAETSPTLTVKEKNVGLTQGTNPTSTLSQMSNVSDVDSTNLSKSSVTGDDLPYCIPHERQVIAVSASKNPAAFFNLARRFLVSDEYCDLSALEGAIVSAVDAAHLLERSKLAKIVRVQTSYVAVEPRRKNTSVNVPTESSISASVPSAVSFYEAQSSSNTQTLPSNLHHTGNYHHPSLATSNAQHTLEQAPENNPKYVKKGIQVRRARIVITVKRTEEYKTWLEENEADTASETTGDHVDICALP
mmetsp:Transcript_12436/g.23333  ORF Transcript_12436/g.23333 Transcript_12436/m.23333 type:complete len:267 (+) Transcript_12436:415-1215(+)